jgi:hypothetical protein
MHFTFEVVIMYSEAVENVQNLNSLPNSWCTFYFAYKYITIIIVIIVNIYIYREREREREREIVHRRKGSHASLF